MRKYIILLITAIMTLTTTVQALQANRPLAGSRARSIEQVLRLRPEEIEIGRAALIISQQWSDEVLGHRYLAKLDYMSDDLADKIADKGLENSPAAINILNDYLFKQQEYKPIDDADDPDDLFIHTVMDNRRGYCLSLSILYLAIGERLDMPLYGVVVPGHFFVRYDDGQTKFNIETTASGAIVDDEHYLEKFDIPEDIDDSIYMKNLNKRQTLGCFFNNLGNVYFDTGDLDQAELALERSVMINPTLAEARMNLGNVYLQRKMVNDAIHQYQLSARYNPNEPKTYNNMANAYLSRENWREAARFYQKAIDMDPDFIDAYRNLASAYMDGGNYRAAIEQLRIAISIDEQYAMNYYHLGVAFAAAEDYHRAIDQYRHSLRLDKNLAEAWYGIGISYYSIGMTDRAEDSYTNALAIDPDMLGSLVNLGNIHFNRGRYEQARIYYNRAASIQPSNASIHGNIGASYLNEQKYERAAQAYLAAVEADEDTPEAHRGLAIAYYYLNDLEKARRHLELADKLGAQIERDLLEAILHR